MLVYRWSRVICLVGNADGDWHQQRNSSCLSNCFQNSGLLIWATANYSTLPQSFRVLPPDWILDTVRRAPIGCRRCQLQRGHRWQQLTDWLGHFGSILHWYRLAAESHNGFLWSSIPVTRHWSVLTSVLAIGHNAHELKRQRPLLTGDTPLYHAVSRWMAVIGCCCVVLFPVHWLVKITCSFATGLLRFL